MALAHDSNSPQTVPQDGDILVSRALATGQYTVAVVPRLPHLTHERRVRAVEGARVLARNRGVDAWLTEDRIHFVRLARFRP